MNLYLVSTAFSFAAGACVASFLNVVIWRLPRGESVVRPPSHCPGCGAMIRWWQNIPVVSWILLLGKCARCRCRISPRYVVVEILGGVLFAGVFLLNIPADFLQGGVRDVQAGVLSLAVQWIWVSLMIAGSFIDFDHKLLPDFTTIGGMALGAVNAAALSFFYGSYVPLLFCASGAAAGLGLLWTIRFFGSKAFGREAMGMGDVLLMGAVGAVFGPVAVLVTMVLSSVFGSVVGLAGAFLGGKGPKRFVEIPYGPYICLGCLAWMFAGEEIVRWYLGTLK